MAVTSQLHPAPEFGEFWRGQWQEFALLKPSAVKPLFASLEQGLVLHHLGALRADDQAALRNAISQILRGSD